MELPTNVRPRDLIAALLLIGCFICKMMGMDGTVSMIMVSIVAYYFGRRNDIHEEYKNGRRKR